MTAPNATVLRNRLLARARLRHLLVFVKTAELGSVRLAAEAVGMAQPSATQALADLERLLESSLFLRHSRGMSATAVGATLLPVARRLLALVDEGATHVAALTAQARSVVRVAAISAAVPSLLARALPRFCRDYPEIALEVQQADGAQQLALVASKAVDLAICRPPKTIPEGWCFSPLLADRFAIVCGSHHPLAGKRRATINDLVRAKWVVAQVSIAARSVFDDLFAKAEVAPCMYNLITAAPDLIRPLLNAEQLLTVVPISLVESELASGNLVEVPFNLATRIDDIGMLAAAAERAPAVEILWSFLERFRQAPAPRVTSRRR